MIRARKSLLVGLIAMVFLVSSSHGQEVPPITPSTSFTYFRVNCGLTAATAASTNPNRRDLRLRNLSINTIFVGGSHVTVTESIGFPLHAAATQSGTAVTGHTTAELVIENYTGPADCIAERANSLLGVLQILR